MILKAGDKYTYTKNGHVYEVIRFDGEKNRYYLKNLSTNYGPFSVSDSIVQDIDERGLLIPDFLYDSPLMKALK